MRSPIFGVIISNLLARYDRHTRHTGSRVHDRLELIGSAPCSSGTVSCADCAWSQLGVPSVHQDPQTPGRSRDHRLPSRGLEVGLQLGLEALGVGPLPVPGVREEVADNVIARIETIHV